MNHKQPIDMSQRHLIPERIKTYAFHIYDEIAQYKSVDRDMQFCMYLLQCAEQKLRDEPEDSPYFAGTNASECKRNGLAALRRNDTNWLSMRNPSRYSCDVDRVISLQRSRYPFFLTYLVDNGLDNDLSALKTLCSEMPEADLLSLGNNFTLETIIDTRETSRQQDGNYLRFSSGGKLWECSTTVTENGRYLLYNASLLDDFGDRFKLRPVFLTEHFSAAHNLEIEIKQGYVDYLLAEITHVTNSKQTLTSEMLKRLEFKRGKPVDVQQSLQKSQYTSDDFLSLFKATLPRAQRESNPCGDAVWVAPVGGYIMPWRTDWSKLANRDIYIFKFGESNPAKLIRELLDVAAAIIGDAGKDANEQLRFIIIPEKKSHESAMNEVLQLNLEELFERYIDRTTEIPSSLRSIYENYLRRTRNKPRSHYILEPFLRRKSWMLLTGEEGVGKTYFAMALGAAIATGGKLFWDWKVRNRGGKVLYIADAEMTDDLIRERLAILKKIYPKSTNRFFVKTVCNLNLLNDDGKADVDRLLNEYARECDDGAVQVVFLDHLLKLTGAEGDQKENWVNVRTWIEGLCLRGIAVCLLHHEYGGKKMLGSRLIGNDAPARIHLQSPSEVNNYVSDSLQIEVAIQKNRGGHDQKTPRLLTLRLGNTPGWIDKEETLSVNATSSKWRSLSKEDKIRKVRELRESCTNREIATRLGCSLSSVEKCIQDFAEDQKRPKNNQ